jgi:hypothetical protein
LVGVLVEMQKNILTSKTNDPYINIVVCYLSVRLLTFEPPAYQLDGLLTWKTKDFYAEANLFPTRCVAHSYIYRVFQKELYNFKIL